MKEALQSLAVVPCEGCLFADAQQVCSGPSLQFAVQVGDPFSVAVCHFFLSEALVKKAGAVLLTNGGTQRCHTLCKTLARLWPNQTSFLCDPTQLKLGICGAQLRAAAPGLVAAVSSVQVWVLQPMGAPGLPGWSAKTLKLWTNIHQS